MKKSQIEKKKDIEAKVFMFLLHLKEEKNKEYSFVECEKNIAYIFDNYNEFKSYFLQNGLNDINNNLLELCIMKTTKKGTIIALKGLCDYTIKKYKMNKKLTQAQIDAIHLRGKITSTEKVYEWENSGLCIPKIENGQPVVARCHAFFSCHDCLLEYASSKDEYDKNNNEYNSSMTLKKTKKIK